MVLSGSPLRAGSADQMIYIMMRVSPDQEPAMIMLHIMIYIMMRVGPGTGNCTWATVSDPG